MSDSWNIGAPTYCNSVPIRDVLMSPLPRTTRIYTRANAGSISHTSLLSSREAKESLSRRVGRRPADTFSYSRAMNQILISEIVSRSVLPDTSCNTLRVSPSRSDARQVEVKFKLPSRKTTQPREVTRLRWYVSGPQYSGGDSTK